MERSIYNDLKKWKSSPTRKPLILQGARQVGKTYILQEFGRREYAHTVYVNCDNNADVAHLFDDYDTHRILRSISALAGQPVTANDTLLILDEVQELPRGLASLKYFCEQAPEYHIAVAGSLLGITLHEGTSYPVGKVDTLFMYPMNFEEFLLAMGQDQLVEVMRRREWDVLATLHQKCTELLRQYYFTGGMPEAVAVYAQREDIWEVRTLQRRILEAYRNDVSKHAPQALVPRINMVWNSIPSQLARDNKKFIYRAIRTGARASQFELAIQWLIDAGLVYKVTRVSRPTLPLKFYEDISAFKLFLLDCGLLGALTDTPPAQILIGDRIFQEYKGAFSENYVLTQLRTIPQTSAYYYSNANSTMEIDFVVQHQSEVIPVEVKSGDNPKAKSLRLFTAEHAGLHALRFSMLDYREQDWMTNVPLFAVLHAFSEQEPLLHTPPQSR